VEFLDKRTESATMAIFMNRQYYN